MLSPARLIRRAMHVMEQLRHALFLRQYRGIIHVGANVGQERDEYARVGLNVLWIEPIPSVFEALRKNISGYPRQRALKYLVLERDGEHRVLNIANNTGASSSVLDFALHRDVWPTVDYVDRIELPTATLDSIVKREQVDMRQYDALVLDTQGSELLVLKGARATLPHLKMVKIEVADFEAYAGCPRPEDIGGYLAEFGFREFRRTAFATHPSGGRYFDIIYTRKP